ncbi:MAG: GNAT family N-acetyltransferase [Candidatus Bipolaricaulota bacterium]|nr:MAG: GNAT family N-acetyltransferase [Candidatus Bipolaricaulota bacterium]
MKRLLYRMRLCSDPSESSLPRSVEIREYSARRHHTGIREAFGKAFDRAVWTSDWDGFDEFDEHGAFVAEDAETTEIVGYVLSFRRDDFGYISVVAVVPEYQRRGVGFALVSAAIRYLRGLGLETIRIDAYVDSPPAVNLYLKVGFRIEKTFEDKMED